MGSQKEMNGIFGMAKFMDKELEGFPETCSSEEEAVECLCIHDIQYCYYDR